MERFALVGSLYAGMGNRFAIFEIRKKTAKSASGNFWLHDEGNWEMGEDAWIRLSDIIKTCSSLSVAGALRDNASRIMESREIAIRAVNDDCHEKLNRLFNRVKS